MGRKLRLEWSMLPGVSARRPVWGRNCTPGIVPSRFAPLPQGPVGKATWLAGACRLATSCRAARPISGAPARTYAKYVMTRIRGDINHASDGPVSLPRWTWSTTFSSSARIGAGSANVAEDTRSPPIATYPLRLMIPDLVLHVSSTLPARRPMPGHSDRQGAGKRKNVIGDTTANRLGEPRTPVAGRATRRSPFVDRQPKETDVMHVVGQVVPGSSKCRARAARQGPYSALKSNGPIIEQVVGLIALEKLHLGSSQCSLRFAQLEPCARVPASSVASCTEAPCSTSYHHPSLIYHRRFSYSRRRSRLSPTPS